MVLTWKRRRPSSRQLGLRRRGDSRSTKRKHTLTSESVSRETLIRTDQAAVLEPSRGTPQDTTKNVTFGTGQNTRTDRLA